MAKSQGAWNARLLRNAQREAAKPVVTLRQVMHESRAQSGPMQLEVSPPPALIAHARSSAGLAQWDVFTGLRIPGATWRAYEKGEAPMPGVVWERFQAWLKARAA